MRNDVTTIKPLVLYYLLYYLINRTSIQSLWTNCWFTLIGTAFFLPVE